MSLRLLLRQTGAGLAVGFGGWLWKQWTLICNESCAPGWLLTMILLSFLLPAAAYWTLLVLTADRPRMGAESSL
ncbi:MULTISPECIES: hypothetical protein [Methylomonas]|uniref:Uncharacterized protein n=2 Tax=Methylomonas TaxID=416 RepID=A0A126T217_9GAMM|nr:MULTISPECIES: hypothetical protein [Methylomonas]AMK76117.1 hypothetical protein JT25_006355 [Methylomonas denitrificans]OAH96096.1 hypothetical protein A1342_14355 [Methylomonas methanica]TCV81386.1 hypothetical protein EDE11_11590 [Methylomonas methanica]